jgi:hypothetical protein
MTYDITPYNRDGEGTITATASTTTECSYARGFRNVAVGATITSGTSYADSRTVTSKTDENTIIVNSAWTEAAQPWRYQNPALTLTGIKYIKHTKNDKPLTQMGIPTKDADYTVCVLGTGTVREIILNGWIQSTTIEDVYKNTTILESLADGSQTIKGTCTFLEEVPPRTSYVYITSVSWQYSAERPKWLDVMINMTECRNMGSV